MVGSSMGFWVPPAVAAAPSWTPASLSSLLGWYDPSNSGSITSSGGAVSQINDLSGAGNHLTQATSGKQPSTGSRTIGSNSLNALGFVGGSSQDINVSISSTAQPYSTAFVVYYDSVATNVNPIDFNNGTYGPINSGGTRHGIYAGGVVVDDFVSATTPYIVVCVFNGASSYVYVNGDTGSTGNAGTGTLTRISLGSQGGHASCAMGENFTDATAWDSTTIAYAFSYLNTKWAVY